MFLHLPYTRFPFLGSIPKNLGILKIDGHATPRIPLRSSPEGWLLIQVGQSSYLILQGQGEKHIHDAGQERFLGNVLDRQIHTYVVYVPTCGEMPYTSGVGLSYG